MEILADKLVYLQALMSCMYGRNFVRPDFSVVIISRVKPSTLSVVNRLMNFKLYRK